MSINFRTVLVLVLVALVALGLAAWGLSGVEAPEPIEAPPVAVARPEAPADPGAAQAATPPVVASRGPRPTLRGVPRNVTSMPTLADVEAASESFGDIVLQPSVSRQAGEAFDLEVSQLLHEKTLALRYLDQILRAAVIGDVLSEEDAEARREDARQSMALAIADLPVPANVENPEDVAAYRERMANRALAVLDDGVDPNDPNARWQGERDPSGKESE